MRPDFTYDENQDLMDDDDKQHEAHRVVKSATREVRRSHRDNRNQESQPNMKMPAGRTVKV